MIIKQVFINIPATVVKLEQYVQENHLLADFVKAFEAADVIFIHVFVEGAAEGDIRPDARNPFVDTTLNLKAILAC